MKYAEVNNIIARCAAVEVNLIQPESSLVYDLHMDSLIFTEMICNMESKFMVKMEDHEISGLYCVRDIYAFLDKQMLS